MLQPGGEGRRGSLAVTVGGGEGKRKGKRGKSRPEWGGVREKGRREDEGALSGFLSARACLWGLLFVREAAGKQSARLTGGQTGRYRIRKSGCMVCDCSTGVQAGKLVSRQANKQLSWQADRQADWMAGCLSACLTGCKAFWLAIGW